MLLFLFASFSIVLSLRDVPKKYFSNQNGGHKQPLGEAKPLRPPIATALQISMLSWIFDTFFFHCLFPKNNLVKIIIF